MIKGQGGTEHMKILVPVFHRLIQNFNAEYDDESKLRHPNRSIGGELWKKSSVISTFLAFSELQKQFENCSRGAILLHI